MIQQDNECWDDNEAVLSKIIKYKEEELVKLRFKLKKITDKKRQDQKDELINELDLKPFDNK